ncbi:MAG: 50S ribosomal protein L29 [Chthonomonadales bacterium]
MAEEKLRETREKLRNMTDQELADELARQRFLLFDLRRQNTSRQLENTAAIPRVKKQIARILTIQRERELAQERR